jgi:polyisoprenoid-binding protein YceI
MKTILSVVALATVCFAAPGYAQPDTAIVDAAKTHITWILGGSVHDTHGTFSLKEGTINVNFEKKAMSGLVVVDAKSGQSGNDTRDHRMQSEVLQSDKYPEIRFTPETWSGDIALTGSSLIRVSGLLELHGAKHQMDIPVALKLEPGRFTGTAEFDVPYVQWGMKDPSNFLLRVEKKVAIQVTVEGRFSH